MAQNQPKNVLIGLGVLAVVGAIAIGIVVHLASESKSEVTGELSVGEDGFTPAHCRSGLLGEQSTHGGLRFRGIDLIAVGTTRVVRVMQDPAEGYRVLVIDEEGAAPQPVDREACERFEVELGETDELINERWGMEGSVDLACPDVSGQVTFAHCYGGR